jgi:hypothetical protein
LTAFFAFALGSTIVVAVDSVLNVLIPVSFDTIPGLGGEDEKVAVDDGDLESSLLLVRLWNKCGRLFPPSLGSVASSANFNTTCGFSFPFASLILNSEPMNELSLLYKFLGTIRLE